MINIRITGAIDRCEPDPGSPNDPLRQWIGQVSVSWVGDGPTERHGALTRVATGRGNDDRQWGQHELVIRWAGDAPPDEVARAVYDLVHDGGPQRRTICRDVVAQPKTEAQHSYRSASFRPAARA